MSLMLPTLSISTLSPLSSTPDLLQSGGISCGGLDAWKSSIGVEIRDLHILASGEIAVAHMLHRTSGTLKNGREVGYWVRATVCCQRSDHRWGLRTNISPCPLILRAGVRPWTLCPNRSADGLRRVCRIPRNLICPGLSWFRQWACCKIGPLNI